MKISDRLKVIIEALDSLENENICSELESLVILIKQLEASDYNQKQEIDTVNIKLKDSESSTIRWKAVADTDRSAIENRLNLIEKDLKNIKEHYM